VPPGDGRSNFAGLHVRWNWPGAIHLLAFNGRELCPEPFLKRQACLHALLERF
jgi:hypothetical protein